MGNEDRLPPLEPRIATTGSLNFFEFEIDKFFCRMVE
jgi:hypothetical protein